MLDESTGKPAAPVPLLLLHATQKRARLKIDLAGGAEALTDLVNQVASVPGVLRAQIRPNTRSMIVESHRPIKDVLAKMADRGIARIGKPPQAPPVNQVLQMGLLQADMGLKQRTGDALDLRTTIALALLGAAAVQIGRGRIAGPATTLALGALSLLDRNKKRS